MHRVRDDQTGLELAEADRAFGDLAVCDRALLQLLGADAALTQRDAGVRRAGHRDDERHDRYGQRRGRRGKPQPAASGVHRLQSSAWPFALPWRRVFSCRMTNLLCVVVWADATRARGSAREATPRRTSVPASEIAKPSPDYSGYGCELPRADHRPSASMARPGCPIPSPRHIYALSIPSICPEHQRIERRIACQIHRPACDRPALWPLGATAPSAGRGPETAPSPGRVRVRRANLDSAERRVPSPRPPLPGRASRASGHGELEPGMPVAPTLQRAPAAVSSLSDQPLCDAAAPPGLTAVDPGAGVPLTTNACPRVQSFVVDRLRRARR